MNGYALFFLMFFLAFVTFVIGVAVGSISNRRVKIKIANLEVEAGSVSDMQAIIDRLQKGPPLSDVKDWKQ